MLLTRLQLHNVRNIEKAELVPGSAFNVFYGDNGAGKTSLLEAIHFLHLGRSFRHHLATPIIRSGADELSVFGQFQDPVRANLPVGIQRTRQGDWLLRIAGEKVDSLAELATLCPQVVLTPESFQLLSAGPKFRRQFLDWGVFHVEHGFFSVWQRLSRVMKQRNAALRGASRYSQVALWDREYVQLSEQLTLMRERYLEKLLPAIQILGEHFLEDRGLRIGFYPGWERSRSLAEILPEHFEQDRRQGYTQYGVHKADIRIKLGAVPAQDLLSRGQQKRLITVLKLAQAKVLQERSGKPCLFLLDDLPSELDEASRATLLATLRSLQVQVFLTAIEPDALHSHLVATDCAMFHVEHGRVVANH